MYPRCTRHQPTLLTSTPRSRVSCRGRVRFQRGLREEGRVIAVAFGKAIIVHRLLALAPEGQFLRVRHVQMQLQRSPRPLVSVSYTHYCVYTSDLSSGWSARGLTRLPGEGTHLETCFLLRCFQQLSRPESATEPCRWRDNSHTGAPSTPVISY